MLIAHASRKENKSPNRMFKRQPETVSLGKTLKRCRGPFTTTSLSNLSAESEMNQIASAHDVDQSCSLDNFVEAAAQPRDQP